MLLAAVTVLTAACTSVQPQIIVGNEADIQFRSPVLSKCPGLRVRLTVTQDSKTVSVETVQAAGAFRFSRAELRDINLNGPLKLRLEILQDSSNEDCDFRGGPFVTDFLPLHPVRDTSGKQIEGRYSVDLSRFREE